ncbi:4-hydroxy-3-methylbut-2-en-1-yl diphosphate synthase [Bacillus sp. NRRL B-14911]|nr:4-hydroxy-3-methylbut-2-en-1-yl diphosphate synthase [Bacillus sp. NRRL B-14911]
MSEIIHRTKTRPVKVGNLTIGGNNELVIQSMTTTKTHDVEATVAEIKRLEEAGCQVVRVACPDERAANAIAEIKKRINIPLVVDIHFDYKLALKAIEGGADKIRINPGNIGRREKVEAVVKAAKEKGIPIRIGVNAGSLEKRIIEKYGYPTADGMVESALHHIKILEDLDFHDIIVSMKASDVNLAIEAYEKAAMAFDYPLHLGITESGTLFAGTVKSAAGLCHIKQRHRKYFKDFLECRPCRGSKSRQGTFEVIRTFIQCCYTHFLPDLRPDRDRFDQHCQ